MALLMFGSNVSYGFEVPEDAVIKVFDKSGKQIGEMSRKDYKVVKLGTSAPPVIQYVTEPKVLSEADKAYDQGYNSVILHAGRGQDGLETTHGSAYEVREKYAPVGGLTLCRSRLNRGLCGSAFTNSTYTLGLKFDFN